MQVQYSNTNYPSGDSKNPFPLLSAVGKVLVILAMICERDLLLFAVLEGPCLLLVKVLHLLSLLICLDIPLRFSSTPGNHDTRFAMTEREKESERDE